ncbi:hypothetical protein [[Flexibacter] sp. ATCC 35208]|uniref:hypothetical protein n=1 Tax=[Flexibacter] sp. ATCC 35208 TaxID=1936242 RepID=UPI0009D54659|nr:hypothetical protein [[Flexibacter] sp. ATCC 35208]OMP78579.1 hypothetical protein BW716_13955 [[Flexibacter] sp. ATCC 35208]
MTNSQLRLTRRKTPILFLLLLFPFLASAQKKITGQITDAETKSPVFKAASPPIMALPLH